MSIVNGELNFGCLATGYPNIRFVTWQSATGINITGGGVVSIPVNRRLFEHTAIDFLIVPDSRTCEEAGGYVCIYDDGKDSSTAVRSEVLACPLLSKYSMFSIALHTAHVLSPPLVCCCCLLLCFVVVFFWGGVSYNNHSGCCYIHQSFSFTFSH